MHAYIHTMYVLYAAGTSSLPATPQSSASTQPGGGMECVDAAAPSDLSRDQERVRALEAQVPLSAACVRACVYTDIYLSIYLSIYLHIHTHTHTHTHTQPASQTTRQRESARARERASERARLADSGRGYMRIYVVTDTYMDIHTHIQCPKRR